MTYNIFTTELFWWTLLSLSEFNAFSMYNHSVGVLVSGTPFWVLCQWEVHPFVGLKKPSSSVGPLETIFVSWWKEIDKASEGRLDWIDKKGASIGEHDFFLNFRRPYSRFYSIYRVTTLLYTRLNTFALDNDQIVLSKKKVSECIIS